MTNRVRAEGDPAAFLFIGQVIAAALAFFSAPIIARAIGVDGRGLTSSVAALAFILPVILAAGVPQEIRRLAARGELAGAASTARRLSVYSFVPSTFLGLVAISLSTSVDLSTRIAIGATLAASPLSVWWMNDLGILMARRRFRAVVLMQVASPLILVASVLLMLASSNASVPGVIFASIAGALATLAIGAVTTRDRSRHRPIPTRVLLGRGLRFWPSALADALSNKVIMVAALPVLGTYETGLLSVGMTLVALLMIVGSTVSSVYYPSVARSTNPAITGRAVGQTLSLTLVAAVAAAAVAPFLIPALFGQPFMPSVLPAVTILFAGVPMVTAFCATSMLNAQNRGAASARAQWIGIAAQGASFMLSSPLGAFAAAIALTVGFTVQLALATRALGIDARAIIPTPQKTIQGVQVILTRHQTDPDITGGKP